MKKLTKDTYYVKKGHSDAPDQTRLWHECPTRKCRVELGLSSETDDELSFVCPRCEWGHTLDKHLELA